MLREIITLDNSRYRKDFNKYFTIGDYIGNTHEISNKELSDQIFEKIFDTINTIIVISPNEEGKIDANLSHAIKEEDRISNSVIRELLNEEEVTIHSRELHESDKADCKTAMRFFNFTDYSELVKFLEWDELGTESKIKAFTILVGEKNLIQQKNIDNDKINLGFPEIPLTVEEKVYLEELYYRFLKADDDQLKPYAIVAKLWKDPPKDFDPAKIDRHLLFGGSITALGIYHIDPSSNYLDYVDRVMAVIKRLIHENEGISTISSELIAPRIPDLTYINLLLTFKLIVRLGGFTAGMSHGNDSASIEIGQDSIYKNILDFSSLKNYYQEKISDAYVKNLKAQHSDQDFRRQRQPNDMKEQSSQNIKVVNVAVASSFIISENVDGVIGVEEQAHELSDLLVDLKPETGMMVGIFGKWGRGKTFLWKHIKSYLNDKHIKSGKPFEFAEFHAWKYQDTPASWAYLYETISDILKNNSQKHRILGVRKNILRMNILRKGSKSISLFILSFLITLISMFIPFEDKLAFLKFIFWAIPTSFLIFAIIVYRKHIPNAKALFKEYSTIPSFKDLLGFQSEIQDELKLLLQTGLSTDINRLKFKGWFSKWLYEQLSENTPERLLLFVDDIDRCNEERIVEIIDSLKVMLEDEIISKKVVVLTAIDESVLQRAIMHKYHDSILKTFEDSFDKKKSMSLKLSREYMDKLFISGVRLSQLSAKEKVEIFDAYTKNKGKVNFIQREEEEGDEYSYKSYVNDPEKVAEYWEQDYLVSIPESPIPFKKEAIPEKSRPNGTVEVRTGDINYEIEEFEYKFLTKCLNDFDEATPRTIRIYYYRYLLAKKFRNLKFGTNTVNGYVWNMFDKKEILAYLIIHYSINSNPRNLVKDRINWSKVDQEDINVSYFGNSYEINRLLFIDLLDIVEMVVPY